MLHAELIARNPITGRAVWLVRQIPSGVFGEPFDWSTVFVRKYWFSRAVTVSGMSGAGFTRSEHAQLRSLARDMGFREARAKRNGRWRVYQIGR